MHITQQILNSMGKVKDTPDKPRVEFEQNLRAKYSTSSADVNTVN